MDTGNGCRSLNLSDEIERDKRKAIAALDTLRLVAQRLVPAGIVPQSRFDLRSPCIVTDYFPTHDYLASDLHVLLQLLDMRALHGIRPLSPKAAETLQAARQSVRREPWLRAEEDDADPVKYVALKIVRALVAEVHGVCMCLQRTYLDCNNKLAAFDAFFAAENAKLKACIEDALSAGTQADAPANQTAGQSGDAADAAGASHPDPHGGPASAAAHETGGRDGGHAEDDGPQMVAEDGGHDSHQAVPEDGGQRKRGRKQ